MARKRMIDPSFWSDDKIIELDPLTRLCFIGLWNFSDDTGVHRHSSKMIKAEIFPADDMPVLEIDKILQQLLKHRLIELSHDSYLLRIRNWNIHQKISHPGKSKYVFDEDSVRTEVPLVESSSNNSLTLDSNISQVNIVEDNIIKEDTVQKPKKTSGLKPYEEKVDEFYSSKISDKYIQELKLAYPNVNIETELPKSKMWLLSNTHRAKRQFKKFINGWMGRAMENKYGDKSDSSASIDLKEKKLEQEKKKQEDYLRTATANAAPVEDIKALLDEGRSNNVVNFRTKSKRRLDAIKSAKNQEG